MFFSWMPTESARVLSLSLRCFSFSLSLPFLLLELLHSLSRSESSESARDYTSSRAEAVGDSGCARGASEGEGGQGREEVRAVPTRQMEADPAPAVWPPASLSPAPAVAQPESLLILELELLPSEPSWRLEKKTHSQVMTYATRLDSGAISNMGYRDLPQGAL